MTVLRPHRIAHAIRRLPVTAASTLALVFALLCLPAYGKPASSITLPIIFDEYNVPHVKLTVNGHTELFKLDTGTMTGIHLRRDWIDLLGPTLIPLDRRQEMTDVSGRHFSGKRFTIKALDINGMAFSNISAVELQPWGSRLSQMGNGTPPPIGNDKEMVIGVGFFRGKQVLIDYPHAQLTIAQPGVPLRTPQTHWEEVPWHLSEQGLTLRYRQGQHKFTMVLDTGTTMSLITVRRPGTLQRFRCEQYRLHFNTGNVPCMAAKIQSRDISGHPQLLALTLDLEFSAIRYDGLLGANFFKQYPVLIDFAAQRLWIATPRPREPRP